MSVVIPDHRCDPCPVYLSASAPSAPVLAAWLRRYEARMTGYAVGLRGAPLGQWADQIRMCGNSVCPPIARALVAANVVAGGQRHAWEGWELAAGGAG